MSAEIKELNEKIDFLTSQVMILTDRVKKIDALKEDASLFAKDAYNEVVQFLDQVDPVFRGQHVIDLVKKLLINMENLGNLMNQLQSAVEFWDDVRPLAKEMFNSLTDILFQLEEYRFFETIKSMMKFPIRFNEEFTPEEIHNMEESFIRILKVVNRFAKPEIVDKIEDIAQAIEESDIKMDSNVSFFKIFRKFRSKEVLQNLNLLLDYITLISKTEKEN
jgi:uncharacterized protein YjgD (DUF1641 family)